MPTDKRVLKTKKAITTAFMELTLLKDMHKITVSDIAEIAVINRSTFYLHYADAKEVLDDIERELSEKVRQCFTKFDISNIRDSIYEMLISLTGELDESPAFKNFMLRSTSSVYIISNIKRMLTAMALETTLKNRPDADVRRTEIALNYMVSGIIDAYIFWANDKDSVLDIEQLCRYISNLTQTTISAIL